MTFEQAYFYMAGMLNALETTVTAYGSKNANYIGLTPMVGTLITNGDSVAILTNDRRIELRWNLALDRKSIAWLSGRRVALLTYDGWIQFALAVGEQYKPRPVTPAIAADLGRRIPAFGTRYSRALV